MINFFLGLLIRLALLYSSMAMACDPNAINWNHFYAVNDKNNDQKIQFAEWQHLSFKGSNFDSGFESDLPTQQIFKQLDTNKNAVLDSKEIDYIYSYLPNPCAHFNEKNSSVLLKQQFFSIEKLKELLNGLF